MEKKQIYRCPICGNVVEVLHVGGGTLVCCGQPMLLEEVKKSEEGNEKHLPVVNVNGNEVSVKVGSIPHPMTEEHFIQWIECMVGENVYKKELKPNEAAEAVFMVEGDTSNMIVRAYCNVHGLWQA
ncbi:MAG: Desulfoferrodoxin [candidate division WS6 bacterium GW2011_GWC2_36_7]|uniref:Desulfoferrodoxin n=1 Tax=candidate division WS6 bacterium GW2011_GWC2_36_7 TaxID=1619091 RepID=A0A0G0F066_9BACT|nr:MAG: Desulfoferrodoxin [candidate division WS6 bacterium GW2011_GWC2_36_7]